MTKVLIKKLDPLVEIPSYKTSGASGMDLMAFIKNPIKETKRTVPKTFFSSDLLLIMFKHKKNINIIKERNTKNPIKPVSVKILTYILYPGGKFDIFSFL